MPRRPRRSGPLYTDISSRNRPPRLARASSCWGPDHHGGRVARGHAPLSRSSDRYAGGQHERPDRSVGLRAPSALGHPRTSRRPRPERGRQCEVGRRAPPPDRPACRALTTAAARRNRRGATKHRGHTRGRTTHDDCRQTRNRGGRPGERPPRAPRRASTARRATRVTRARRASQLAQESTVSPSDPAWNRCGAHAPLTRAGRAAHARAGTAFLALLNDVRADLDPTEDEAQQALSDLRTVLATRADSHREPARQARPQAEPTRR